jgi:asparagine synthase (glutamine-hydrolysing)
MCGIFGWVLSGGQRQSRETLARLTDLMSHRGPDGAGCWLSEATKSGHQVALGHRRLSIIDISGGAQPMWSADGTIAVVFNGEIYNYLELRDELAQRGHRFRSQSDTEVLIESYRAWGLDAVRRFRGMFAFALWDGANERLVLARDPFGKKPLFIAERAAGGLLFASEIEPIVRFPGFDRGFDPEALGHYLLNRYVPGPLTFFRNVRKLQPGHYCVWQAGRLTGERYFIAPFATAEPDIGRFDEAVELFTKTFDEAVRLRMRSDAPFGAYLSGGIDSSAVVAAMARHSRHPIRTFSVGFREQAYSELDHARAIARQFGTDHSELVVEPEAFFAHWPLAVLRRGAPVSESSDIPILLLSQAASAAVKMVLTGEGSDELLGGYPKHRAERWIGLYQQLIPSFLHEQVVAPLVGRLPYGMRRIKIAARAAGERDAANRMRIWFGGGSAAEGQAVFGRRFSTVPPDAYPFSARSRSRLRRTLFFDQTSWLPDNLLERGDRMMMAGSIEGRMPFMDTELAAAVARLPDAFLIGCKGGKAVLRATMRSALPPHILARKKIGFRVPFNEWFRGPYRDLLRDMLTSDQSTVARLCRHSVLRRLTDEHIAGKQNHEKILWSLTNLEMFLRTFKLDGLESVYAEAA